MHFRKDWNWHLCRPCFVIFKNLLTLFFMCVLLCLHLCLCTTWLQCPRTPEEGAGSPGTGATDTWAPPHRCWESNPSPLQEQPTILTSRPHNMQFGHHAIVIRSYQKVLQHLSSTESQRKDLKHFSGCGILNWLLLFWHFEYLIILPCGFHWFWWKKKSTFNLIRALLYVCEEFFFFFLMLSNFSLWKFLLCFCYGGSVGFCPARSLLNSLSYTFLWCFVYFSLFPPSVP